MLYLQREVASGNQEGSKSRGGCSPKKDNDQGSNGRQIVWLYTNLKKANQAPWEALIYCVSVSPRVI